MTDDLPGDDLPDGAPAVHVVLPGGVDDPGAPSGGNTYDLRVVAGLETAGRRVAVVRVVGAWPHPAAADLAALDDALAAVPDGEPVLLDGLVACTAPDVLAGHAARVPLVPLVHLPLADETGLDPEVAARLDDAERRTLRHAAAVLVTGTAVARRLTDHHGVPAHRVHVALPGADPAPASVPSDGGTRLLCVASVTPRKGHDVLVAALARVADLSWTCDCAGPGDRDPAFARRVDRLARDRGLTARMRLLGPRTGARLDALYAGSDLLVLPSRAEPYGMVVTEALARGIPAVVSAVDGLPEALGRAPDGTLPGILVPPDDPGALADALRAWLTDPELRTRLRASAAARRTALRGWGTTTAAVAAVLDRVVSDGNGRPG